MWRLADAIRATPQLLFGHVTYLLALADLVTSLHEPLPWGVLHGHEDNAHGAAAVAAWADFRSGIGKFLEGEAAAMEHVLTTAGAPMLSRLRFSDAIAPLQIHATALAESVSAVRHDLSMDIFTCCCKLGCLAVPAAWKVLSCKALSACESMVESPAWLNACATVAAVAAVPAALNLISDTFAKWHEYKEFTLCLLYAQHVLKSLRHRATATPPEATKLINLLLQQ